MSRKLSRLYYKMFPHAYHRKRDNSYRDVAKRQDEAWTDQDDVRESLQTLGVYLSANSGELVFDEVCILGFLACIYKPGVTQKVHGCLEAMRKQRDPRDARDEAEKERNKFRRELCAPKPIPTGKPNKWQQMRIPKSVDISEINVWEKDEGMSG